MDTFRWIAVVVSMILGLGVTRLLSSAVAVFKSRHRANMDSLPLIWAAVIFVQQVDFWWSLEELAVLIPRWSFAEFLMLVGLVLLLFLAAALILPQAEMEAGDGLRDHFDQDGRFALLALAMFSLLALVANLIFWGATIVSIATAINLLLFGSALVAMMRSRTVQLAACGVYVLVALAGIFQLSPASY